MNAPDPLRIVIISDLHVVDDTTGAEGASNIRVSEAGDPALNPLTALQEQITHERLTADLLLCPGDLCDRADPDALRWAWAQLGQIAKQLGAELFATTGNHDVDSRLAHKDVDTYGALLDLRPHFPAPDNYDVANEFFARGFTVGQTPKARVVLLDSCFLHRERDAKQLERGFLTQRVLDHVADIAAEPPEHDGAINVVVCHHQPLRWTEFGGDEDRAAEMRGGERLVRVLEQGASGGWIVIHGHCHTPALDYLGQTSGGPVRLAAGSIGGALPAGVPSSINFPARHYWSGDVHFRNQVYLLEIARPGTVTGVDLAGRFRAWDWLDGWQPAKRESMIPGEGGFGFRASGLDLAARIVAGRSAVDLVWSDLIKLEPRLEYLAPCDMNTVAMMLREGGHGVLRDENGRIEEVSLL